MIQISSVAVISAKWLGLRMQWGGVENFGIRFFFCLLLCLSVTLLNSKVCKCGVTVKTFELRNSFGVVG